jgi:hypothetical protein
MLVPINLEEVNVASLAQTFGCALGSLPFTYLGPPLGLTKPKVVDFLPLVSRCKQRLNSTSVFLSQAGRLEVTNAIFTALPMFHMGTFLLHKSVIKQIDKFRKHCLWRGANINAKTPPKAAWESVCLPKKGGLGVFNLRTQNGALLHKHLHKFFNRADIPWVHLIWEVHYSNGNQPGAKKIGSFWWRDILMAMVNIRDGATCLFWSDLWSSRISKLRYPELFSFAKKINVTFKSFVEAEGPAAVFHLPISMTALE